MEINKDPRVVTLDVAVFKELMYWAHIGVCEAGDDNTLRSITRHIHKFNEHIPDEARDQAYKAHILARRRVATARPLIHNAGRYVKLRNQVLHEDFGGHLAFVEGASTTARIIGSHGKYMVVLEWLKPSENELRRIWRSVNGWRHGMHIPRALSLFTTKTYEAIRAMDFEAFLENPPAIRFHLDPFEKDIDLLKGEPHDP